MLNVKTIAGLVLIFLIVGGISTILASLKVTQIACNTQYGPCSSAQTGAFSYLLGKRLLSISRAEVIAVEVPGIRNLEFSKHFSGKLSIMLEIAKPVVALTTGERNFFLADREGNVVGEMPDTSLPKLIISPNLMTISSKNPNLANATRVVDLLFRAKHIERFEITDNTLGFRISGSEVLFPLNGKNPQILVGSLQFILSRSTIDGKEAKTIDLRFKNPVVIF